ncbi:MAG TPA: FmdB family zinc ribbon protein [Dehalococcoidia bacterium]|nr:FmdB family zinc ribbon protein [Dehalococcoidia bacterium]
MPLYDYKCTACSNRFELRQGFDAAPRQPCPECGQEAKRVLYPPPIVFKGSGFYITDSRKGSSATLGDSGPDSATMTAPVKKDDSKPAATESKPAADKASSTPATTSSDD